MIFTVSIIEASVPPKLAIRDAKKKLKDISFVLGVNQYKINERSGNPIHIANITLLL